MKTTRCSALTSSRIAPHIRIPDLFCTSCAKNLSMLMCGRSENVRKCPSELGICGRFPRYFNHIISEISKQFTLKGGGREWKRPAGTACCRSSAGQSAAGGKHRILRGLRTGFPGRFSCRIHGEYVKDSHRIRRGLPVELCEK